MKIDNLDIPEESAKKVLDFLFCKKLGFKSWKCMPIGISKTEILLHDDCGKLDYLTLLCENCKTAASIMMFALSTSSFLCKSILLEVMQLAADGWNISCFNSYGKKTLLVHAFKSLEELLVEMDLEDVYE